MAIAVDMHSELRRSTSSSKSSAHTAAPSAAAAPMARRNSTLFRRVTAQAMGMKPDSLCHKSHWVPKSSRAACANCKRAFKVFLAKRNCRLCGEVVCGACSTKRILFQKKSVRSCDDCINQSVESISRLNSINDASDTTRSSSSQLTKCRSESDMYARKSGHAAPAAPSTAVIRQRMQSLPTTAITTPRETKAVEESKHKYRPVPRVESWRMQLPYVVVFFLMTIAGITNVLALTA